MHDRQGMDIATLHFISQELFLIMGKTSIYSIC